MSEPKWQRLADAVAAYFGRVPTADDRREFALLLQEGALRSRCVAWLNQIAESEPLPDGYDEKLPPRLSIFDLQRERDYSIPFAFWEPQTLGAVSGDWWASNCAEFRSGAGRVKVAGIEIDVAPFDRLRGVDVVRENRLDPYNDSERQTWMREHGDLECDAAHRLYRQEPRSDGTKQREWRSEWREVIGRGRGRPVVENRS